MNHRLNLKFEQLELATQHLLASVAALGPDATRPPGPGQWAATQVVHHLLLIENNITGYVQKKLLAAELLPKAGPLTRARALCVRVLLRLPGVKFRAPRGVAELTTGAPVPGLPALQTEWAATRRRIEQVLNEYPGHLLNRAIYPHPRSGRITIYQVLEFLLDHLLHHQQQVNRIAKALATKQLVPGS
ncbi:DinB family protein [Hymenobacter caeli]|uniref:Damage-inducible protein DinB n=1 Tax=Hymenobacter caeli TaxID=2735894 RepID=A0ABX2FVE3_9BACT|nr:DinB family protein [Hymenobacter caeli]NRT20932.1 putative damage-inducible protein DinB [Hymenobacter caeli]